MPTKISAEMNYQASCGDIFAMYTDEAYILKKLAGTSPAPDLAEANPLLDLLRQRMSSTTTAPTHAVTPHLAEPASAAPSDKTPDAVRTRRINAIPRL